MKSELYEGIEAVSSMLYRAQESQKVGHYIMMYAKLRAAKDMLDTVINGELNHKLEDENGKFRPDTY